jgi:hypothetical protein
METTRKARKEHICDICHGVIRPGNKYIDRKYRTPKVDRDEIQIGIEYINYKTHEYYCNGILTGMSISNARKVLQLCRKGIHEFKESYEFDHYVDCHKVYIPTGEFFCEWCGHQK